MSPFRQGPHGKLSPMANPLDSASAAMDRPKYQTTIVEVLFSRITESGDRAAVHVKRHGKFQPLTWNEVARDVRRMCVALGYFGVRAGDRVVQVGENSYEWIVADLAIMTCQAVHVPVHAPLSGAQLAFQIRDSGAKIVLLSGAEQAEKLASVADQLPADGPYFSHEDCYVKIWGNAVRRIGEVAAQADQLNLQDAEGIEQAALRELSPDSLATILYTSGTTGEPKGVCLTQRNLVSNAMATLEVFDQREGDLRLAFLPLSHIFARTCDLYTWIISGGELAIAEKRETIIADAKEVKPTHISGVPYFYDKVHRGLVDAGAAEQPGAFNAMLGGRLRMCAGGGAALPDYLYDFYEAQGNPVLQGYGLTETSPVITVSSADARKKGSSGRAIPDVEIRIADDGEILTRGPHVMQGYWQNEAATGEMIDADGWLATGDLGHLDEDGFLFITGRKKEIIVTAAGKNVAPALLESLLTEDPLIIQAMIVGDDRRYLSALIVPDPDHLKAEIKRRWLVAFSTKGYLQHAKVQKMYEEIIARRLAELSHHEQVRRFTLLDRGFTIESGELTPKSSLRREVIAKNFAPEIEAMYDNA